MRDGGGQARPDKTPRAEGDMSRLLIEGTPSLVCGLAPDGTTTFVNPAVERATGYTAAELVGRNWWEVLYPGPERRQVEALLPRVAAGDVGEYEMTLTARDGTRRTILWNSMSRRDAAGAVAEIIGFGHDITERKRAETALRRSEERFRSLLEYLPDVAVQGYDPDGTVRYWNPASEKIYGWRAAEAIGRDLGELIIPPEIRPLFEKGLAAGAAMDHTGPFMPATEALLLRKDGSRVPVFSMHMAVCQEGQGPMLFCIDVDLSERRRAEEALRHSEARYRALVEQQVDTVCRWTPDGTLTFVNEAYCRAFGRRRAELLGTSWFDLVPEAERARVQAFYRGVAENPRVVTYEHAVRAAGGEERSYQWIDCPIYDPAGDLLEFQSVGRDVTDLRCAEQARQASQRQYRRLVEQMNEGLCTVDDDLRVTFANARMCEILGLDHDALVGQKLHELLETPPETRQRQMLAERRQGRSAIYEVTLRVRGGREAHVRMSSQPLVDEEGTFRGALAVVTDLTEHKRLERRLEEAQHIEALGRLAGGVAHDFNNQMTVVQGYCRLLQQQLPPGDPVRTAIDEIANAADRATQVTAQLLAFSRKQMLNPTVVDLNEVLRQMENPLGRVLGESVRLRVIGQAERSTAWVDRPSLERALANLAVNASDAMPDGGELTMETATVRRAPGRADGRADAPPGLYVLLAVRDTGVGMDAETRRRVFEPFFTTKEVGKGTGLGLSMVYGFVRQSGGFLEVDSAPGQGTTCRIFLPWVARPAADAAPADVAAAQELPGGTEALLVAEDDQSVRDFAAGVLRRCGYTVHTAASGQEALRRAEAKGAEPALALVDVVMPQMRGPELVRTLRRRHPDLAAVYISGYAHLEAADSAEEDELLTKPFTPAALAQAVRRALDRRAAKPANDE